VGSNAKLDRTYVDEEAGQAICFWVAPDKKAIEDVFQKAGVEPESVREVKVHSG
jgi:uncharacterized protein YpmB